jgi:hypothetical protein
MRSAAGTKSPAYDFMKEGTYFSGFGSGTLREDLLPIKSSWANKKLT